MRRPYPQFKFRRSAPACNPLRLERLEDRLALSHGPIPLPYESVGVSPLESRFDDHLANSAYTARMSPEGDAGRGFDAPASFGAGLGSILPPFYTGNPTAVSASDHSMPVVATPILDSAIDLVVETEDFGNVIRLSEIRTEYVVHVEPAPSASLAVADPRVARPADAVQVAIADSDHHANQPASATSFGAEALTRAPQTANAVAQETRIPTGVNPTVSPQAAMPMNALGDAGINRGQPLLALVPQPGQNTLEPPNSTHLQSESILAAPLSIAAVPGGQIDLPTSDSMSLVSLLSSDHVTEDGFAAEMSDADKGALLASLPFNMDAVDQALIAMMSEVEGLGGEFLMWMDDSSAPSWAIAAGLVAAGGLGGRYLWKMRGGRSLQEETEEESSSWLFTRLQSPAGQL